MTQVQQRWLVIVGALAALVLGGIIVLLGQDRPRSEAEHSPRPVPETAPDEKPVVLEAPPDAATPAKDEPTTHDEAPSPANAGLTFTGTVTDGSATPVAGAAVSLELPDRRVSSVRTDDEGRFELSGPAAIATDPALDASVVARQGERVATVTRWQMPRGGRIELGTLILASGHGFDLRVVSANPGVPPATVIVHPDGLMGGQVVARLVTDDTGRARVGPIAAGTYRLTAYGAGGGRGYGTVTLPQATPEIVDVDVEGARDVTVTVVGEVSGEPIEGARLAVWDSIRGEGWARPERYVPTREIAPTDAQGQTTIPGLTNTGHLLLEVTADGWPKLGPFVRELRAPEIEPGATAMRVEMPALRTVRWRLTSEEGGRSPPDGTNLTLTHDRFGHWPGLPDVGWIEGGHVVVEGLLYRPVAAKATTPDGEAARLVAEADGDMGTPTTFRVMRAVDIVARYPDGTPATGISAFLRSAGNKVIGKPKPIDERGTARFEELEPGRIDVLLGDIRPGWGYGGWRVATVDLRKGDQKVEAEVARKRRIALRVTLDGHPGLPEQLVARTEADHGSIAWPVTRTDVAQGLAHVDWRPRSVGARDRIWIKSPGWLVADSKPVIVDEGARDGITREVALVRGGAIELRVLLPESKRARVRIQALGEDETTIRRDQPVSLTPEGTAHLRPLQPGRYRVVEKDSGAAMPIVEVGSGRTAAVTFDLRAQGWADGRVEVPDGIDVTGVRVHVAGRSYAPPWEDPFLAVRADGTFRLLVSGTEALTLTPEHPLLRPAREQGVAEVRLPLNDIVLRMERGPRVRAILEPAPVPPYGWGRPRLLAFDGDSKKGVPRRVPFTLRNDTLLFGSLPSGTWTLWLDVPGFAPTTLPDVRIPAEGLDLGALALSQGSTVRIRVTTRRGGVAPAMSFWVQSLDSPPHTRGVSAVSAEEIVIRGLAAGRYVLRGGPDQDQSQKMEEELRADGTNTIERTFEVR